MIRRMAVAAALALLVAGAASAKTHVVNGRGVGWDPKTLEVARGDVVEWKNVDVVPHNVREDKHVFWSKNLDPGQSYKWKANKKGKFLYRCTLHPEMTGTLTVK
jgi:plastocyanin